jgi:excisionase family DNA binding protein
MATQAVLPQTEQLYVGRETAAQLIGVSAKTIDEAIRARELEAYRVGRRVLIPRAKLIEFAEKVSA